MDKQKDEKTPRDNKMPKASKPPKYPRELDDPNYQYDPYYQQQQEQYYNQPPQQVKGKKEKKKKPVKQKKPAVKQPPKYNEVWIFEHNWNRGLTSCCECPTCCYAFWCFCCLAGSVHKRNRECVCSFCMPGGAMIQRTKMRTGFRLQGSICRDFIASLCCPWCVYVQMSKELDAQEIY